MTVRWQASALCKGMPTNLWYPERGWNVEPEIRALCRRCPVQSECDEAGMGERYGMWGGHTYDDRLAIKRERRMAS